MTHIDGYVKWLRSQVGHEMIYLVYTIAFVFNERDELLVQERYDFDWLSVPGGVYEPHETIEQAVLREVYEETGIHCQVERLIGVFSHPDYNLRYPNGDEVQPWTVGFVCRAVSNAIQVDGKEALQASFRPVAEVYDRFPLMYQHAVDMALAGKPFIEPVYALPPLRPYYPILRQYVGQQRVILPGAMAVIFNEVGELLAVQKVGREYWSLPGGLADLGETTTHTLRREVFEETGLEVEPIRIIGVYSDPTLRYSRLANGDELQTVGLLMECQIVGGQIQPDGEEIAVVAFKSISELLAQPDLKPSHRQIYTDILERQFAPFIR
jgi:8-oxo-dGTP pyrophosphatase MutT (NUDIX family)